MEYSSNISNEELEKLFHERDNVLNDTTSFIRFMTLKCAVQLGIFDAIQHHGKALTIPELGIALAIHPSKVQFLPPLIRVLIFLGYLSEQRQGDGGSSSGSYALTPSSCLLLEDHPLTARPLVQCMFEPLAFNTWNSLNIWFKNDDNNAPFASTNGMSMWEHASRNPEFSNNFNKGMATNSKVLAGVLINNRRWQGFEGLTSLVDVGGGRGEMAKAIAAAYPQIKCSVLDLPHAVDGLDSNESVTFIAGSMFEGIPPADAVLLKMILHNWNDQDAMKILLQCKKAITSNKNKKQGKVILIEMVIDDDHNKETRAREVQLFMSMNMLTMFKGRERNEKEWKKLFEDAGFRGGYKIYPILGFRSLIEIYP